MALPYRIELYDKDFIQITTFPETQVRVLNYSFTINKAGVARFAVTKNTTSATKDNLKKFNRIKLMRYSSLQQKYIHIWSGYIEAVQEQDEDFEVGCIGLLNIFDKRLTSDAQALSGTGGTLALDLLDSTNTDDDTSIGRGTSDYTEAIDLIADRKPLLQVWEDIAQNESGEFEIDIETNELNFKKQLGSDKSSTIRLVYNEQRPSENNLDFVQVREDAKTLFNRVIGYAKDSGDTKLISIQENASSIANYGLLETVKAFDNVESQAQLDDLTLNYLNQFKIEIDNPEIRAIPKTEETNILGQTIQRGLDLEDIRTGDIITYVFKTMYTDIEETRRIVSISVSIDGNGNEDIRLLLNKVDQRLELNSTLTEQTQDRETIRKQRDTDRRLYRT